MGRNAAQRTADTRNLQMAKAANIARRVYLKCLGCGATQLVPPSIAKRRKFCSWECRQKNMPPPNAGGGEWMQGEGNPNWKGGKPTAGGRPKYTKENNRWRRVVYRRDSRTCQECGFKAEGPGQLNAHHIKPWAKFPDDRFDVDNGVTLCLKCHRTKHN